MKKIISCCLFVLVLMACGEKSNDVLGRWSMEFESDNDEPVYSLLIANDSICTSNLIFNRDTVYMQIKSDDRLVSNEFIGKYTIKEDSLRFTNRYGKLAECKFSIKDDLMTVVDKKDPNKIIMRLKRIKIS